MNECMPPTSSHTSSARTCDANHCLVGDTDTVDKKLGGTYIAECVEYSIEGSHQPYLSGTQQAPPPPATQNVDLGILTCGSEHRPGDRQYFVTIEEANSAVGEFCDHLHDNLCKCFEQAPSGKQGYDTDLASEQVTPRKTTTITGSKGAPSFVIALLGALRGHLVEAAPQIPRLISLLCTRFDLIMTEYIPPLLSINKWSYANAPVTTIRQALATYACKKVGITQPSSAKLKMISCETLRHPRSTHFAILES